MVSLSFAILSSLPASRSFRSFPRKRESDFLLEAGSPLSRGRAERCFCVCSWSIVKSSRSTTPYFSRAAWRDTSSSITSARTSQGRARTDRPSRRRRRCARSRGVQRHRDVRADHHLEVVLAGQPQHVGARVAFAAVSSRAMKTEVSRRPAFMAQSSSSVPPASSSSSALRPGSADRSSSCSRRCSPLSQRERLPCGTMSAVGSPFTVRTTRSPALTASITRAVRFQQFAHTDLHVRHCSTSRQSKRSARSRSTNSCS